MIPSSVLVVEDEALIADDLERTLTRLGYTVPAVVTAADQVLQAATTFNPSLVLMDIRLAGRLDGVDAARELRSSLDTPVVFLTSHSDSATLARASAVNPYGFVSKPFAERELRVAIELALHKHRVDRVLGVRERWFATTLASLGEGVVATDEQLQVTFINRVAERVTGWTADDALGKPIAEVLPLVDDGGRPREAWGWSPVDGSAPAEALTTSRLVTRGRGQVFVAHASSPIVDARGRALGLVVVLQDVTGRRELEQRVARSERLASLGTMVAGICHEINNPLTVVLTNAELCLRPAAGAPDELREALVDVRDAAVRINDVVTGMRAFGQVGEERRTNVDLGGVVNAAVKLTAHIVRQHARLERLIGPSPAVFADSSRLTQVLVNLIANAAQAIPSGDAAHHLVQVSLCTGEAGDAVVEITDDGQGIDPAVLPRVFDPFFTTKAPGGGMGLGLSICANIIEGYAGGITVRSTVGRGTTFTVRLPASPHGELAETKAPAARAPVGRRGRILIADDEVLTGRALVRALSEQHQVETCADGAEALERIVGHGPYDAVLCDLMMPRVTGMELYEAVRARLPEQAARFIFVTGGATTDAARDFLLSAGRPVIAKPITDLVVLRQRVAEQVGSGPPAPGARA